MNGLYRPLKAETRFQTSLGLLIWIGASWQWTAPSVEADRSSLLTDKLAKRPNLPSSESGRSSTHEGTTSINVLGPAQSIGHTWVGGHDGRDGFPTES